jgi:hypothetical protein
VGFGLGVAGVSNLGRTGNIVLPKVESVCIKYPGKEHGVCTQVAGIKER